MATVVRIIFRLDFESNYEIINRPGDAIQTLMGLEGPAWDGYLDGQKNRQVGVTRSEGGRTITEYEDMNLDPRSLSGNREWKAGIPLDSPKIENLLDRASSAFEALKKGFHLDEVARVGVRFFVVGPDVPDPNIGRLAFNRTFSERFLGEAGEQLKPADAALIIEGSVHDEVKYRIQTGPGGPLDLGRFHDKVPVQLEPDEQSRHQFVADIDIYEQNISFKGITLVRWYRQKIKYFERLIAQSRAAVAP